MQSATLPAKQANEAGLICGMAALVRHIYEGRNITPISNGLIARVSADPHDAAAFLDLSTILLTLGQREQSIKAQCAALALRRNYEIRHGNGSGPRILVLLTAGDFMANTPIDFLLENSDATLLLHYVDADTRTLDDAPSHDVAFVAVGESAVNRPVLERLEILLARWRGPIMNRAPRQIMALTRDGVARTFSRELPILAPRTVLLSRETLHGLASNQIDLGSLLPDHGYPIIVRPAGTHAGQGMEKLATSKELGTYLLDRPEEEFYLAPFIDYGSVDGKFRKQRIAVIDGKPFASHLAVSDHWMVHYLSAGMAEHQDRRAEEAEWMDNFDTDFAVRHAAAFDVLYRRLGLDYFAIDCAELPDGRLLLFEADVAMIVHAMDSAATFPYKKKAMQKLFDAFGLALANRAPSAGAKRPLSVRSSAAAV